MIDKDSVRIILAIDENKVYVSSLTEPFSCDTEIWVGDDFVYRLENEYVDVGKENSGWRWHKPNKNFHGNVVKVILKNVPVTKVCEVDPYGEELWESDEIFIEKSWDIG